MKTGRKPKFLWVNKGREFYNRDFKKLLNEKGISLYSPENEEKSRVVERWNRTIKNRIFKLFIASDLNLNLYGEGMPQTSKPKFKVGDKVRISKYKRKVFDKGYTPNWTEEIFVVDKIQFTNR